MFAFTFFRQEERGQREKVLSSDWMEDKGESFSLSDAAPFVEFWKEFDLDNRRPALDKTCVELRELKTGSINGRKKLNEITKLFRSKQPDEQLTMMTELLKAYQEEIDQLSKRSKASESAFNALYKDIYDAPDPLCAIEGLINMVTSSSSHQFEVERLRSELAQYEEEFQQLKNQDITIRRLEDQLLEYKEKIEDKVVEEVAQRSAEINELAESRIAEVRDLQRASEKRLAAALEAMKQAQQSAERAQNQLYEVSAQAEDRLCALSSENAILAEGSERAQSRIAELEGEIEALRNASLHSSGRGGSGFGHGSSAGSSLEAEEAQTLQLVIADLRNEVRRKEDVARADKHRLESAAREATQALSREREAASKLRQELAERPSKDDIKAVRRQLKMLQRVAFNAEDDDDEEVFAFVDACNFSSHFGPLPGLDVKLLHLTMMTIFKSFSFFHIIPVSHFYFFFHIFLYFYSSLFLAGYISRSRAHAR